MRLSAPIYRLKRQARLLSRKHGIPHHEALDRIARDEGFASWSLLSSRVNERRPSQRLLAELEQGDLLLVGGRPGHGKTLLSLEIAIEAMKAGQRCLFFSLECTATDVARYFAEVGADPGHYADRFEFDDSDHICAAYIVARLRSAAPGTVAVIDYLQLLDQKRENASVMEQVRKLREFARTQGLIVLFVSQVHRSYDPTVRAVPTLDDVRLPNPLDLTLFSKTCFVHDGEVEFGALS